MENNTINKSSRHSKICGDFGEYWVCYNLSKLGFECNIYDHTGIDIIAFDPKKEEQMGISVKTRTTESNGKSNGGKNRNLQIPNVHFSKIDAICNKLNLFPYMAFVIDTKDSVFMFLMKKEYYLEMCPMGKSVSNFEMKDRDLQKYLSDVNIRHIQISNKNIKGFD